MIRLATGDLSAVLPGASPCGRTNMRIKGWMGRADQTTKVKGMFVRPEQVAEVAKRHPELGRVRLVVAREGEQDAMTLHAEAATPTPAWPTRSPRRLQAVTKLRGEVKLVAAGLAAERRQGHRRRAEAGLSFKSHVPAPSGTCCCKSRRDSMTRIRAAERVPARRSRAPRSRCRRAAVREARGKAPPCEAVGQGTERRLGPGLRAVK